MTTKYVFFKTALICTVFSAPLFATEDQQDFTTSYLIGQSKTLEVAVPQRGMISEFASQFRDDITHKTKSKFSHAFDLGKKIIQDRDLGPLVVDMLEGYLTAANQKLIGEFFKPKNSLAKDEFDVEALRPLVEAIRNKLCDLIGEVFLKRNLVGYLPDGKAIKIYENRTVFNLLLDAFIPDLVPAKKLIIKVSDIGPIRNYLMDKFDEMIIKGILSLYQKTTGKAVKQSISDLVSHLTARSKVDPKEDIKGKTKEVAATIPELRIGVDHKETLGEASLSLPSVADEINQKEIEEEGSHVWEFLEP
ncbi:MAG TPA: hypothetical protein VNJ29_02365, partial [Candidatus Nitrosotenuis sp.]|nr:hypothetical protein [Candidatus Nitrosotenuis sp.]